MAPEPRIPPDVLARAVQEELARMRRENAEKRQRRAEARTKQPATGRYAAVSAGRHRRRQRPPASPDDRQYVPGALKHWRTIHGLSQREAQARIGYSPTSSSWRGWESGHVVPSYSTLLRIIVATGMGFLRQSTDPRGLSDVDPTLLLEASRAAHQREVSARRARRRRART